MPKQRSWSDQQLVDAVTQSKSYRAVLLQLGLVPAGGNYAQIKARILALQLDITHFTGQAWNEGWELFDPRTPATPLSEILVKDNLYQSFKLKKRLFAEGLKTPKCELCGWAEQAIDGRIPVELDHINGDHSDNRIENLRVLCPNCHCLQPTHRGKNKKTGRVVERYTRLT